MNSSTQLLLQTTVFCEKSKWSSLSLLCSRILTTELTDWSLRNLPLPLPWVASGWREWRWDVRERGTQKKKGNHHQHQSQSWSWSFLSFHINIKHRCDDDDHHVLPFSSSPSSSSLTCMLLSLSFCFNIIFSLFPTKPMHVKLHGKVGLACLTHFETTFSYVCIHHDDKLSFVDAELTDRSHLESEISTE